MGTLNGLSQRLQELRIKAKRSATELSLAAGLSKNTVSEIEANPTRSPRIDAVKALARELGVSLAYLAEGVVSNERADGLAQSDVASWSLRPPAGERPDLIESSAKLARTLAPQARSPATYICSKPHPAFGLLDGDILVIDLAARPENGDLVVANVVDLSNGSSAMVLRRLMSPYLVPSEFDSAEQPLVADGTRTAIKGKLVASFRAPQLL